MPLSPEHVTKLEECVSLAEEWTDEEEDKATLTGELLANRRTTIAIAIQALLILTADEYA